MFFPSLPLSKHTLENDLLRLPDRRYRHRHAAFHGERTKTAAVTKALEEFVARRQQRKLLKLFGTLEWDRGYDYKKERSRG